MGRPQNAEDHCRHGYDFRIPNVSSKCCINVSPCGFPIRDLTSITLSSPLPAPPPEGNPARMALSRQLPASSAPEATAPWMRLFVSLMTNDATHTVTAVAVLGAFHTTISTLWRGLLDPASRASTVAALRAAQHSDVSGGWRGAAIDRAVHENREGQIMALVDLHRVALAYVTNKKGGDQIMDALDAAVRQRHRAAHQPLERFISRLISGGIDMKEIQEIMEQAKAANSGPALS